MASASASSSGVSGYSAPFGPELRQARVGHHRQRDAGVLGQRAQVLAHLGGAGGAVQADEVDAQRLQRGEGGADLAAEQHRAGGLHRDLGDQRDAPALGGHRPLHPEHGRLDLQQVLAGLDDERVGAAGEQPAAALGVGVAQPGEGRVAERRAAWCPGPTEPRTKRGRSGRATSRRRPRGPAGAPFSASSRIRSAMSYSARLGRFAPNVLVSTASAPASRYARWMCAHDVGAGVVEDLVAALEPGEVVERQVGGLQHRAHRAVGEHHALGERVEEGGVEVRGSATAHMPTVAAAGARTTLAPGGGPPRRLRP